MNAAAGFAGYAGAMVDAAVKVAVLVALFAAVRRLLPAGPPGSRGSTRGRGQAGSWWRG